MTIREEITERKKKKKKDLQLEYKKSFTFISVLKQQQRAPPTEPFIVWKKWQKKKISP